MTAEDTLRYVYAVTFAEHPAARSGLTLEGEAVDAVRSGPVAALVGAVPAAEFSAEVLPARLGDLVWVERLARRHFAVVAEAFARGPVLPLRMCTVFATTEGVERMLVERSAALHDALGRLGGRAEWSVKVIAPTRGRPSEGVARHPTPDLVTGVAYLSAVRERRDTRQARAEAVRALAQGADSRLAAHASDAVRLPVQSREIAGRERAGMLLNAAYLVPRDGAGSFVEAVERVREELDAHGLQLEVDGPWPPYSFVPELEQP